MSKNRETLEMAKLLGEKLSYAEIGNIYRMTPEAVGARLRRSGVAQPEVGTKMSLIDKTKLAVLYEIKRKPVQQIAESCRVSARIIRQALAFHSIPKRPALRNGGKYHDRLRKLAVGETIEIECTAKYGGQVLASSVRRLQMKVSIKRIGDGPLFRVTRIDPADNLKDFRIERVDPKILKNLYYDQGLNFGEISRRLNLPVKLINCALATHAIPKRLKRRRQWGSGKYTSVFKDLAIGESVQLECTAKRPYNNLHTIAVRIGIKVTLKKVGAGLFKVTRIL